MDSSRPIRIRSHDDGVDRWLMADAPASAALRGRVNGYCDYSERTAGFSARAELASTQNVLIFCLGDPLELTGADGQTIRLTAGQGFVAGFADGTSLSRGPGEQAGLHVHMNWTSLAALIDAPVAEIANRTVSLDDFGGHWRSFGQRLGEANGPERRFALLDAMLEHRLADASRGDAVVAHAVRCLQARPDTPIDALARHHGWSRRHFITRFRDQTGMTPGRFARLARFERFWTGLAADPDARLADLAQDAGYHDEAHLSRTVRDMVGMTPGALRASLIPAGGGFAAG